MQLSLKKSRSSYDKKYSCRQMNPQTTERSNLNSSHVEEMILQKYNFSHRVKTNTCQKPAKYQSVNQPLFIPNSNVIAISQFPKISHGNSVNSKPSLIELHKIRQKQKQNSIEIYDYAFIHPPPRKISEYKDCIKRIQMNTTYQGFNYTKSKFHQKNRYPPMQKAMQKVQIQKNEDINKTPLKAAERKMIIQYIIEKGFARKMEDSLIKVRKEKKKVQNQLLSTKNTKTPYSIKTKRSVIFSQTESLPTCNIQTLRNIDGKEHLIEPW